MGLCDWRRALLHTCLLSIFAFQKSAAALAFTNPSLAGLTAGAPYNLTWSGASGTTTVTLQNGTANDLEMVVVIASDVSDSFLEWSPYAFTPSGSYVVRLEDTSGQTAVSDQFTMMPAGTKTSSTTGLHFTLPSFEGVNVGSPINITWSGATGSTTLTLQNGTENSIHDVDAIATDIQASFFVWTPPATIPSDDYVFQLKDDSSDEIAYSNIFRLLALGETLPVVTAVDPNLPAASTPDEQEEPYRPAPSHPNISLAAKIGVAVGSIVLTLLVIGIVIFYRRRHRNPMERMSMSESSDQFLHDRRKPSSEMGMLEPTRPRPAELGDRGRRLDRRSRELGHEEWR
ncbi:hypothetical protein ONS95_000432 [Cadophora gregata]|uniref:uncharacterized protein n=1 Tax=Cadophora gregata TaxID=51156 RepID=UPI0026DC77A1|nr:uncharacterized protein ONS95_000432 [Cadophora gregata]KAK0125561.1 hypothetical protein ONS96_009397 [Cadophora gregata f. sp. sojae]KAK0128460.1 hypothetical protein ONS95_000432 [Cadophora gregata]